MLTAGKNVIHTARWFALAAAALVSVTACGSTSQEASTTTSVTGSSSTPAAATTTTATGVSTTVPAPTSAPSAATTTTGGHTAEPGKPGVAYTVTVSDVSTTRLRPGQRYSAINNKPGAYFDTATGDVVEIGDDVLTDNGKATLLISPTVIGDTVVFARQPVSSNGFGGKPDLEVVAADIGSGEVRWTHPQPADTVSLSGAATGDGYVYGHSNDDQATHTDLHAIVVSTGAEIDLTDICGPPTKNFTGATWGATSIVATDGDFVVECELILNNGIQDRIARRVQPDGTEVWSVNTHGSGGIGPHVGDNVGSLRFIDGTKTNFNCERDVCLDEYVLIDLPNQQSFARYRLDEVPAYEPLGSLNPPDDAILRDPTGAPIPAVSRLDGHRVVGRSKAGLFVIDVATGNEEPLTLDGDLVQILNAAVLVRNGDKLERLNL